METSYLLAGTPVIAYADGKQVNAKPVSQPLTVDFGKGLGRKTVWLYNLPEVESAFKYMKVPNVSARFGTDPGEHFKRHPMSVHVPAQHALDATLICLMYVLLRRWRNMV